MLDIDHLLKAVSDGNPCGDALDYDLSFLELEMAAQGRPGQQMGDSVVAGVAPDWHQVWQLSLGLAARTKDLRVGVMLTRSALSQFGYPGLRQGFELLAGYVEFYWPELHPRPDTEDCGDQTVRLNALANLCDPSRLIAEICQVPVTASRQFGNFTLHDWMETQRPRSSEINSAPIEMAFGDTDPAHLCQLSEELDASLAAALRLDASVKERVDVIDAVRFEPLISVLRQGKDVVNRYQQLPQSAIMRPPLSHDQIRNPEEIRGRNDVISILDWICRWYHVNEPASPVPALLERAKRLVSKDFMALLTDLAPDGAAQYRTIAGAAADSGA
ncbi:type VI secretion system protein TssA [Rhizobium lentis]|uniref:Type VI secretion system protein ImpA n=1 Tax=Rhizobium binae TaxID=1138190 RepID=A0ABV2MR70_9HYPH|nr:MULTISPECIES: type VI secretion system protein TssA [Rhizobium]NKL51973.1 type VI secretion system protein TssA [Rhizobium leguminosarum bv. viciae]MBX4996161.1 type VI secretion system protein TssA [Rhizobium binae]MBX5020598.1 type VI secretion system protein TssA [Rhizobium lentis]MBX5087230.1 type VI secretion system protein TssA [Rhizobium lentis]MBX5099976.1 type VI secretion system protein TssA [Rhizobium lentis]